MTPAGGEATFVSLVDAEAWATARVLADLEPGVYMGYVCTPEGHRQIGRWPKALWEGGGPGRLFAVERSGETTVRRVPA